MSWQLSLAMICILIGMPVLCGLVSWEAGRFEHRQHRRNMDNREAAVSEREAAVLAREFELGRRAHDLYTMLNMRKIAIETDTTVMQVLDWSEPA